MNDDKIFKEARDAMQALVERDKEKQREGLRGERGEKGAPGAPGADGKDAPLPDVQVGSVQIGDTAKVSLQKHGTIWRFDFVLPRGERGEKGAPGADSHIAGPQGIPGESASKEDISKAVVAVINEYPHRFRGPVGEVGPVGKTGPAPSTADILAAARTAVADNAELLKGERGERGEPAYTKEDITNLVVEILSTAGVLSAAQRQLVEIKTILRRARNHADSRHQVQVSSICSEIETAVFGESE